MIVNLNPDRASESLCLQGPIDHLNVSRLRTRDCEDVNQRGALAGLRENLLIITANPAAEDKHALRTGRLRGLRKIRNQILEAGDRTPKIRAVGRRDQAALLGRLQLAVLRLVRQKASYAKR